MLPNSLLCCSVNWLGLMAGLDLDQSGAVTHSRKFEVPELTFGGRDKSWNQIQQVSNSIQELDVKQGQRLRKAHQINCCWSVGGYG